MEFGVGGEAGYFIADNLALKLGLGYSDIGSADNVEGEMSWKAGVKYYLRGKFPLQVDINGKYTSFGDDPDDDPATPPVDIPNTHAIFLGLQAGYAWFIADNVSIETALRYGIDLNDDAGDSVFGVNAGFNFFF